MGMPSKNDLKRKQNEFRMALQHRQAEDLGQRLSLPPIAMPVGQGAPPSAKPQLDFLSKSLMSIEIIENTAPDGSPKDWSHAFRSWCLASYAAQLVSGEWHVWNWIDFPVQ
jgi:hypothetical protein